MKNIFANPEVKIKRLFTYNKGNWKGISYGLLQNKWLSSHCKQQILFVKVMKYSVIGVIVTIWWIYPQVQLEADKVDYEGLIGRG